MLLLHAPSIDYGSLTPTLVINLDHWFRMSQAVSSRNCQLIFSTEVLPVGARATRVSAGGPVDLRSIGCVEASLQARPNEGMVHRRQASQHSHPLSRLNPRPGLLNIFPARNLHPVILRSCRKDKKWNIRNSVMVWC